MYLVHWKMQFAYIHKLERSIVKNIVYPFLLRSKIIKFENYSLSLKFLKFKSIFLEIFVNSLNSGKTIRKFLNEIAMKYGAFVVM